VGRLVHISVTNHLQTPRSLISGKFILEASRTEQRLTYAIIRLRWFYALRTFLVKIAYLIRRLLYSPFPEWSYRLQPIYAGDLAEIVVQPGSLRELIGMQWAGDLHL